jgi:acyl carrier protein
MAVVALIARIEERFGFTLDDDEIESSTFATVGSLVELVESKLAG